MFPPARWLVFVILGSACALPQTAPLPAVTTAPSVHVVSHGWHTGVVVRRSDVTADSGLPLADFPGAEYIEFGWGERNYYQARDADLVTILRATFVPGPGVLHVVGVTGPVATAFPHSEVVELPVTRAGLDRLVQTLSASIERDAAGQPRYLGPGLYGDSRFYGSVEQFDLIHNCNAWTAKTLNATGLPVESALSATGLMSNARTLARTLGGRVPPAAMPH